MIAVEPTHEFADVCPGCGIPFIAGAIVDAVQAARQYHRVFGLMPDVELSECDAVYLGDVFHSGEPLCPRCGADPRVEATPPVKRPDDREFLTVPVVDLEMSIRARNLLHQSGAETAGDLLDMSPNDLRRTAATNTDELIEEIREFLALRSLSLKNDA